MRHQFARSGAQLKSEIDLWLDSVEAADGQSLEAATRNAYIAFCDDCVADGNWDKLNCLGSFRCARSITGLMIPIKGPIMTNNNFALSDLNRKTGLKGRDTVPTFINTNYLITANPQNDFHFAAWITEAATSQAYGSYIGGSSANYRDAQCGRNNSNSSMYIYNRSNSFATLAQGTGFVGSVRTNSVDFQYLGATGSLATMTAGSVAGRSGGFLLFAGSSSQNYYTSNHRKAFWSIGRGIGLDLLKLRQRFIELDAALTIAIL